MDVIIHFPLTVLASSLHGITSILVARTFAQTQRVNVSFWPSLIIDPCHHSIVVTIPIDLSSKSTRNLAELEEKGVRGLYVCVEHIQEMAGDIIEWRRVACLNPGGFIPRCMAQKGVLNKLVEVNDLLI